MRVKELMTSSVICAKPETSVPHLAALMKQENVGAIPICNHRNEVIGMVTDRDIVLRCAAAPQKTPAKASDIMTKKIIHVTPNMSTHDAALLLAKYQLRRLPVIENGKLVGMFTLADLARKPIYIDEAGDALNAISKWNAIQ